jgi:hypothetical protein
MSKIQTTLAKSIQRKEDRVKILKWSITQAAFEKEVKLLRVAVKTLEEQITEDEKLLPEERESYLNAMANFGLSEKDLAEQHFDTHYTQETNIK